MTAFDSIGRVIDLSDADRQTAAKLAQTLEAASTWRLDDEQSAWLAEILDEIRAALNEPSGPRLRAALGELLTLGSTRLTGINEPDAQPAPELPRERTSRLVHDLLVVAGADGSRNDTAARDEPQAGRAEQRTHDR